MMQHKPYLLVSRMQVYQEQLCVYDETFGPGLNVIRGENSTGKSTVMDFMFFALGGEVSSWKSEALKCTLVLLEANLNGSVVTLGRDVSTSSSRPMKIYWGTIDDAVNSGPLEWQEYPYRRSEKKFNFSQILLYTLNFPDVAGEAGSNITIHQVLRLLYSDQLSSIRRIFRSEDWDGPLIRQTVGDLLCGVYDQSLYKDQLRLRDARKEFDNISNQVKSIYSVLGKTQHNLTRDWIDQQKKDLEKERADLERKISDLREDIRNNGREGASDKEQKELYSELAELQRKIAVERQNLEKIEFDISDSSKFMKDIESKLQSVDGSIGVHSVLGLIELSACPACFSELERPVDANACPVCRTDLSRKSVRDKMGSVHNALVVQLSQSREIQSDRKEERDQIVTRLRDLEKRWSQLSRRYKESVETVGSESAKEISRAQRRVGYIERELQDLEKEGELIDKIEALSAQKADLQSEIESLEQRIEAAETQQEEKKAKAYTKIAEWTKYFLHNDLARQDTFLKAEHVGFSFSGDWITVDGEESFSASSQVYLKNSFRLGMFAAALTSSQFRFPRFVMFDNIEDKGMEVVRSHNFQIMVRDLLEGNQSAGQAIITTSMIVDELEDERYTVGHYFTHDKRALRTR